MSKIESGATGNFESVNLTAGGFYSNGNVTVTDSSFGGAVTVSGGSVDISGSTFGTLVLNGGESLIRNSQAVSLTLDGAAKISAGSSGNILTAAQVVLLNNISAGLEESLYRMDFTAASSGAYYGVRGTFSHDIILTGHNGIDVFKTNNSQFTIASGGKTSVFDAVLKSRFTTVRGTLEFREAVFDMFNDGTNRISGSVTVSAGGILDLSGSKLVGNKELNFSGNIIVQKGGSLKTSGLSVEEDIRMTFADGSSGTLYGLSGEFTLSIDKGAYMVISGNDFSNAKFEFTGSGTGKIDLSGNYWGTSDLDAIYTRLGVDASTVIIDDVLLTDPTTTFNISSNSLNKNYLGRGVGCITFTFSHDIDPDSVSFEKMAFSSSAGEVLNISSFSVNGKQLTITFEPPEAEGNYRLAFDNSIKDIAGASLVSLRESGLPAGVGEMIPVKVDFTCPYVVRVSPDGDFAGTMSAFTVYFSGAVDPATFSGNIQLIVPDGRVITPTSFRMLSDSSVEFTVPEQTAYGAYQLRVLNGVADYAGNQLDQDRNGFGGEENDGFAAGFVIADVDLKIQNLMLSKESVLPGEAISVTWEVINASGYALCGSWTDGVYLSKDKRWDVNDILLGSVTHADGLGENQMINASLSVNLAGVLEGNYYILVRSDIYMQEQTNREAAEVAQNLESSAIMVAIPALTQNTAVTGTIRRSGDYAYYTVRQEANQSLKLVLDSLTSGADMEIYVSFGSAPTTEVYDRKLTNLAGGSLFLDAQLSGRDVYIMVRAKKAASEFNYTLTAQSVPMSIAGVSGSGQSNRTTTCLDVSGVDFTGDSVVTLTDEAGNTYSPTAIHFIDSTRLKLEFAPGTLAAGDYVLTVASGGETATYDKKINITNESGAQFDLTFNAPSVVGRHATATLSVQYGNSGYDAMGAVLVVMAPLQYHDGGNPTSGAYITLDQNAVNSGFWTSNLPDRFAYSVSFLATGKSAGMIMPGESAAVPIYYTGWRTSDWDFGNSHIDWNVYYVTSENTSALDWSVQLSDAGYSAGARAFLVDALAKSTGTTWGAYVSMLDKNLKYLDDLGSAISISANSSAVDTADLYGFEIKQVTGRLSPHQVLQSTTDISVKAGRLPLEITREYRSDAISRYEESSFGYGWTCNWDISLKFDSDGNIIFKNGGSETTFQPNYYNGYTNVAGTGTEIRKTGANYAVSGSDGTVYVFSSAGLLQNITDEDNNKISCAYTGGKLTRLTHSNGTFLTLTWNEAGYIQSVADQDGKCIAYTYDTGGNLISAGDAAYTYSDFWNHALTLAGKTTYAWNENGLLASVAANGATTTLAYGENGEVYEKSTTGTDVEYYYGASGNLLKKVDNATGIITQYRYDSEGRYIGETDNNGNVTGCVYDAKGNLTSLSRNGKTTSFVYNSDGSVKSMTDASGIVTEYEYNSAGLVTAAYCSNNTSEAWSYDSKGRVISYTDARGTVARYGYDANGSQTSVTIDGVTTEYAYDADGRCIGVSDALNGTTAYAYNADGRLTAFTDALGNVTMYRYDDSGMLDRITYADGTFEAYAYTADGSLSSWTSRAGETISYASNDFGLIAGTVMPDGTEISYAYDAAGNMVSAGELSFAYDAAGNIVSQTYADGRRISYAYDSRGYVISLSDELGHVTNYTYTVDGNYDRLTDETGGLIVDYDYNADGSLSKITHGDGSCSAYTYNVYGEVTAIENYTAAGRLDTYTRYTYNSIGLRTAMATQDGSWAYSYDQLNQLIGAVFTAQSGSVTQRLSYTYDAMGNRLTATENGVTTVYSYNNLNQIVSANGFSYRYDANGNLLEDEKRTYTWTADNRVASETLKSTGQAWVYGYDALGNRTSSTTNGVTTTYTVDVDGNVLGEYVDGAWSRSYYQGGLLAGWTSADGAYYFNNDALGSVVSVTGVSGTANTYSYDPFGNVLNSTENVANDFEYVGGYGLMVNDSGTTFVRARNYDPETGRWISADPMEILGGDNTYVFCFNNAVYFTDISGAQPMCLIKSADPVQQYYISADPRYYDSLPDANRNTRNIYVSPSFSREFAKEFSGLPEAIGSNILDEMGTRITKNATNGNMIVAGKVVNGAGTGITIVSTISEGYSIYTDKKASSVGKALRYGWLGCVTVAGAYVTIVSGGFLAGIGVSLIGWAGSEGLKWADGDNSTPTPNTGNGTGVGGSSTISYSSDPNDKLGPEGYGEKGYVSGAQKMDYTVRFENEEDATAPARWIRVLDTLDESLDLDTFVVEEFCLAGNLVTVGDGRNSYNQRIAIQVMGNAVLVDVAINLDPETRRITASFMAIDPETGSMLQDVANGLLFPNDASGRGDGHIRYSVDLADGVTTDTEVTNKADIYFDFNDPIETPVVLNTVDSSAPVAAVPEVAAGAADNLKVVRWSAGEAGSGVASYRVEYRVADGDWISLYLATAETSFDFSGDYGTAYQFRVCAVDFVGNRGGWSDVLTFTVSDETAPVVTAANVSVSGTRANFTWSASDNVAVAGCRLRYGTAAASTEPASTLPRIIMCWTVSPRAITTGRSAPMTRPGMSAAGPMSAGSRS